MRRYVDRPMHPFGPRHHKHRFPNREYSRRLLLASSAVVSSVVAAATCALLLLAGCPGWATHPHHFPVSGPNNKPTLQPVDLNADNPCLRIRKALRESYQNPHRWLLVPESESPEKGFPQNHVSASRGSRHTYWLLHLGSTRDA